MTLLNLLLDVLALAAPSAQPSSLLINEIMQSNVDGLVADSDFPDSWVELYNTTSSALSLQNYRPYV